MSSSPRLDLSGLTESQRLAVEHADGPLLILAGPGSGKTRVVTHRIARLCERGVPAGNILAITFTNKAAHEMAERVRQLLPGRNVWISTFHRFCARLLRVRGAAVGLQQNYTILDTADQTRLLRQVLHDLDIDSVHFPPRRIAARISKAKNDLQTAEVIARKFADSVGNHFEAVVARVYPEYQKRLLQSNAVDFDDLLLHVVALLQENEELRRQLGQRYRYILVDEYQDTNLAQYRIVSALAAEQGNLCVTGDPDQSIYGWRGARIDNILRFERDFPNAAVIRLEHNFRSTGRILKAADELIAHNAQRKAKSLRTNKPDGQPVECLLFDDGRHEADALARHIRRQVEEEGRGWSDFALFYRVNALSRELERAFTRHRVPFQIASGVAFYDRAEVKDMLAYLRLILNPDDEAAFRRIINTPKRGIGKTTLTRLSAWAQAEGISLFEAAARCRECPQLSARAVRALTAFAELMGTVSLEETEGIAGLVRLLCERVHYGSEWRNSTLEQDQQRWANVEELFTAARQYDESAEEPTLEGFLETTSLVNEVDNVDEKAGRVTLMTLHAAKGLEFPVVYIVGVEHGLLPHERSLYNDNPHELEEERRLLFVGMTRAKERLYLTQTGQREFRGRNLHTIPSEFLTEFTFRYRDGIDGDATDADATDSGETDSRQTDSGETNSRAEGKDALLENAAEVSGGLEAKLMRASQLPSGAGPKKQKVPNASPAVSMPPGFAVGSTVRHPQYGVGVIREAGGYASRPTVVVEFIEGRRQSFVIDKSPLQPVGLPS